MNYYERILGLLEQGPSYEKAVKAEKAAIKKYGPKAATSLTTPARKTAKSRGGFHRDKTPKEWAREAMAKLGRGEDPGI